MASFTVYLLRDDIQTAEDAVAADAEMHLIAEGMSEYGKLFVKPRPPRQPKWAGLFERYVDPRKLGKVQSTAAVFVVPVDKRLLALTFGHGRFIIRQEAIEERFGLLVTLNSVKSDALRSIDKRTFVDDQNSRVQTSQASGALAFGVNIERDLIRGIVGYPDSPEKMGRKLAGADALTVTVDAEVPDLKKLLRRYLKAFESKDYQTRFPWVDQVRQLRSRSPLVEELNRLLLEKLQAAWTNRGLVDGCWMAVPDIVDWTLVRGFKFTQSRKEGVSGDLNLPGLYHAFSSEAPTVEFLRAHHALAVNEDEQPIERWPLYRCLHCEVDRSDKSYILSAGHWFEVDQDFARSIDKFVAKIPMFEEELPVYNHDDEGAYNEAVVAEGGGRWCLMDKKLLKVGGVHDKVEFCDVYGDQVLLHIKHYGSSSVLGHLFNQGLVSGGLLKSHAEYVKLANEKLGPSQQLPRDDSPPRDVSIYTIVFGVISESAKPGLHLPFFSKVVLKAVYTQLRELGFEHVKLAKIECNPAVVLIKKLQAQMPRRRTRKRVAA